MRKRLLCMLSGALIVTLLAAAAAVFAAGDASDPLVSLSYITDTFVKTVLDNAGSQADEAMDASLNTASKKLGSMTDGIESRLAETAVMKNLEARVLAETQLALADDGWYSTSLRNVKITLEEGERLSFREGTQFTLLSGGASIAGARSAEFVRVTDGAAAYAGLALAKDRLYMLASDSIAGIMANGRCELLICGEFQVIPKYTVSHTDTADVLAEIGLFKGTGNGYSLERQATRLEALIMFLRLIGEEDDALAYTGSHPFKDVPYWAGGVADRYIAYAYHMGYFNGVSATRSGASDPVTAEQYITFVLRALGYSSDTQFDWSDSPAAAVRFGVITEAEKDYMLRRGFYRDMVAYVSYRTLFARVVSYDMLLLDKLVADGVISTAQAEKTAAAAPRLIG